MKRYNPEYNARTGQEAKVMIFSGGEYMPVNTAGEIGRNKQGVRVNQSQNWRLMGAVERSKNGGVAKVWSLYEVLNDPDSIPWKWKNGKQRTHLVDYDHGTQREWMNPGHYVMAVQQKAEAA